MVAALGVNQAMLFTGTLFLGAFLAGLGGALQIPRVSANAGMDLSIIAEAFVVTVVGGMGSVPGAFLAALIIGQLAGLRHPDLPEEHPRRGVPADGAWCWSVRPYGFFGRARNRRRHARDRHREPQAALPGRTCIAASSSSRRPRRASRWWRTPISLKVATEILDLRAVRLQPAAAHRRRRARELRPCGLLRPRRLRRGACREMARRADGGRAAARARPGGASARR